MSTLAITSAQGAEPGGGCVILVLAGAANFAVVGRPPGRGLGIGRLVVIVGQALWQRRSAATLARGKAIGVNGVALTIIGIAPDGFSGLTGRAQIWIPATMAPRLSYVDYLVTNQNFISVVGRLRDGVTMDRARAQLSLVGDDIERALRSEPASNPDTRFSATALSLAEPE